MHSLEILWIIISIWSSCCRVNIAHQIILGYTSDYSDFVVIDDDISSSSVSSDSSSGPSESSRSEGWAGTIESTFCQCNDNDFLVKCLTCRSYFELDTFCLGF
jgi:hypothetical protein